MTVSVLSHVLLSKQTFAVCLGSLVFKGANNSGAHGIYEEIHHIVPKFHGHLALVFFKQNYLHNNTVCPCIQTAHDHVDIY